MAEAPKTDIQKKLWESIVRRHLLSVADVSPSGTYDEDLANIRNHLGQVKSGGAEGKITFHPNAAGSSVSFADLQKSRGAYTLTSGDEERILKELAKKTGEERMVRAKHQLEVAKHNDSQTKFQEARAAKWTKIHDKLFDKYRTNPEKHKAEHEKAWDIFHKETEVEFAKNDKTKPKLNSTFTEAISADKEEGNALLQHKRIMAFPEKERAAKFKEAIKFWDEPLTSKDATDQEKTTAKFQQKRLQQLAEESGIIKPKIARGIAAVGGAIKKAGAAVLPSSTIPSPSPLVRPVTAAPAPAPVASVSATPVPTGLPLPPSAATIPSTSTASAPASTPAVWTGPNTRVGVPAPAVDDAQAQLARLNGQGGVSGVSRGGVAVNLTTAEEIASTKPTRIDKTNANSIRPPSYENPVQVKIDTPSETTAKQTEVKKAQLEEQARTGKLPPKSKLDLQLEQGGSLLDIAKRQLPTVFKVADALTYSVDSLNKAESARLTAEAKVKADAKTALARLAEKPSKTFYNPNTGRSGVIAPQLSSQQASGVMSPLGDRVSRTLYSDILPYARGIQNPQVELPAVFGNDVTQKSFIEKALVRSGRFTSDEIGGVTRSILNNPDAMSELTRVIGHLPVDNQPLTAGGAPKPFPQRQTGNSLPKVTTIEETARDRLAAQRQLQAEEQALAEARAKAAQEAELLRIAAEEKAAFDQLKHDRLVEAAGAKERQALIDEIKAKSPTGNEPAWAAGTRFGESMPFVGNSGLTRQDRLRQISIENKKGVTPDEVMLQKWLKSRLPTSTPESQAATGKPAPFIRGMERGVKPPSAGMRAAGQIAETGLHGLGYLPDIMSAYALSRGGPISGSGQVLYPNEVTSREGEGTYETAALNSLARWHPDNAAENPDITHQQRNAYWEKFYGNANVPRWYRDEADARNQDLSDWLKRTGFVPEPMQGSKPVPQAILDAIRSQR